MITATHLVSAPRDVLRLCELHQDSSNSPLPSPLSSELSHGCAIEYVAGDATVDVVGMHMGLQARGLAVAVTCADNRREGLWKDYGVLTEDDVEGGIG